jgi:hypothetical protein
VLPEQAASTQDKIAASAITPSRRLLSWTSWTAAIPSKRLIANLKLPRSLVESNSVWRLVLFACAVATAAPLWAAKYLPFTDLPEHVATMATLGHWFDPSWPDSQIYALSGRGSPYLAYHVAGALLARVTGDALLSNRLLLTATAFATPYATRALVVAFGGDERLALFGCLAFWSRPLAIGFLPFMAAVPVTLFVLALLVRQREAPKPRRAVGLAASTLLVFYLHLDPFILIVAVAVALNLAPSGGGDETFRQRLVRLPVRAAWLGPAAVAAGVWLVRAQGDAGLAGMGEGPVSFLPAEQLAAEFPAWAFGLWRSHVELVVGIAAWTLLLVLALTGRLPEPGGLRGLLVRFVPFGCAALLFTLLPFRVGVTRMLNVRFAIFLLPTLLVVLRPDPVRLTGRVLAAVALLTGVVAVHAAVQVHAAERAELAGVDALLGRVSPGARLLALEFDRESAFSQFPPWTKVGALHRLRGGGVASVSFAEVPHWPIHFRPGSRPPGLPGRDLEWHPCDFRNGVDGPYYDYVLVRGPIDPFRDDPPGPRWRLVGRAAQQRAPAWALFERSGGPEAPVLAGDAGPCSGVAH